MTSHTQTSTMTKSDVGRPIHHIAKVYKSWGPYRNWHVLQVFRCFNHHETSNSLADYINFILHGCLN